ncbi:MAG: hypothetical protein WAK95_00230 [Desulfobacterales bacterium]
MKTRSLTPIFSFSSVMNPLGLFVTRSALAQPHFLARWRTYFVNEDHDGDRNHFRAIFFCGRGCPIAAVASTVADISAIASDSVIIKNRSEPQQVPARDTEGRCGTGRARTVTTA